MLLPFRVEFGERALEDLRARLAQTRWPVLPFETGWSAGTDDGVLRDLVRYWYSDFDWAAAEVEINRRPHVRGPVDDGSGNAEWMHAMVLAGPGGEQRIPLLLIHGWPGSFVEFLDAADLLVGGGPAAGTDDAPAFDVVVPSLPGFGFSEAARAPGMHPGRVAERLHALMLELGYTRYGVQGGDWGAWTGTALAERHPEAVIGLHLNFLHTAAVPPSTGEMPEVERSYREAIARWQAEEGAYSAVQRTKPQSLAYGLTDSPVGLLAWQLEKFWGWSDHGDHVHHGDGGDEDADLWSTFDRDRLLMNVTLYWLTGTVLSSSRLYYERSHADDEVITPGAVRVPVGFAAFPAEPWPAPRALVERAYPTLRHYEEQPAGGHFAAMEQPALFAKDVARFFRTLA
jgi:microsomal epoxide hydrolase